MRFNKPVGDIDFCFKYAKLLNNVLLTLSSITECYFTIKYHLRFNVQGG
jgi:hypothetical protein